MPTLSATLMTLLLAYSAFAIHPATLESSVRSGIPWYEVPDLSHFDYLDTKSKIPEQAKQKALAYFELYKDKIPNKEYITVFDASAISGTPRLHLIHLPSGQISSYLVAHGKGSDSNHDGYAEKFSNKPNSNATSLGFYLTDATYTGGNGYSLKLRGLESTNSNAYARAIVIHGASYVDPKIAVTTHKVGRSQGCPAVETRYAKSIINKLKNGSILYIWTPALP